MSIETTIENIDNVYENIDIQTQRIKSNVIDAISTVATRGRLTLNGDETLETLPSLVDSVETYKSYPNGMSWTIHSNGNYAMSCLEYGNGVWIIGNRETEKALYSTDGKTWNAIPNQPHLTYVKYANGIWVGSGYEATSYLGYSIDGVNWTKTDTSFMYYNTEITLYIRFNGQMWLLVTDCDIYFSYNGIDWNVCESSLSRFEMRYWTENQYLFTKLNRGYTNNFIYRNGRWIGANEDFIITLDDGGSWVESNLQITNYFFNGIYQSEDILISICDGVWYSTDNGLTWVISNIGTDTAIVDGSAIYANGKWVIAYTLSDSTAWASYSSDGITWTTSETVITQSQGLSLEYYNGIWFICNCLSDDQYSAYSLDGIIWNEINSAEIVIGYNCGVYVTTNYFDRAINYNLSQNNDYTNNGYNQSGLVFSGTTSIENGIYPMALYKNGIWVIICENVIAFSVCWEV